MEGLIRRQGKPAAMPGHEDASSTVHALAVEIK
jgi:hypothetical protein